MGKKGDGKTKGLLVISLLDVQTMGLNGLEASNPEFLPTQTHSLSVVAYVPLRPVRSCQKWSD